MPHFSPGGSPGAKHGWRVTLLSPRSPPRSSQPPTRPDAHRQSSAPKAMARHGKASPDTPQRRGLQNEDPHRTTAAVTTLAPAAPTSLRQPRAPLLPQHRAPLPLLQSPHTPGCSHSLLPQPAPTACSCSPLLQPAPWATSYRGLRLLQPQPLPTPAGCAPPPL